MSVSCASAIILRLNLRIDLCSAGHRIFYEPAACLHHLRVSDGGTRVFGDHLRSFSPNHSVGAYYFTLRTWSGWQSVIRFFGRPLKAIATRHHLRQPWWIPATLVAELSGMAVGAGAGRARAALFEFQEMAERRGIQ